MIEICPLCGGPMPVASEFKSRKHFEAWSEMCQRMARCTPCLDKLIDDADLDRHEVDEK